MSFSLKDLQIGSYLISVNLHFRSVNIKFRLVFIGWCTLHTVLLKSLIVKCLPLDLSLYNLNVICSAIWWRYSKISWSFNCVFVTLSNVQYTCFVIVANPVQPDVIINSHFLLNVNISSCAHCLSLDLQHYPNTVEVSFKNLMRRTSPYTAYSVALHSVHTEKANIQKNFNIPSSRKHIHQLDEVSGTQPKMVHQKYICRHI